MKTIYLVNLRFKGHEKLLGSSAFSFKEDAHRYKELCEAEGAQFVGQIVALAGPIGIDVSIEEVEFFGRNEWNPLPVLEESCV